jgi:holo-[acyl-carrier protein] synthase
MAIVGHGIDVVDIVRFNDALTRTPGLAERLFSPLERDFPTDSLAARFAAKEALVKALGGSDGLSWIEIEIPRGDERPYFVFSGGTAEIVAQLDIQFHLSMSHDGGIAMASVIAETR